MIAANPLYLLATWPAPPVAAPFLPRRSGPASLVREKIYPSTFVHEPRHRLNPGYKTFTKKQARCVLLRHRLARIGAFLLRMADGLGTHQRVRRRLVRVESWTAPRSSRSCNPTSHLRGSLTQGSPARLSATPRNRQPRFGTPKPLATAGRATNASSTRFTFGKPSNPTSPPAS